MWIIEFIHQPFSWAGNCVFLWYSISVWRVMIACKGTFPFHTSDCINRDVLNSVWTRSVSYPGINHQEKQWPCFPNLLWYQVSCYFFRFSMCENQDAESLWKGVLTFLLPPKFPFNASPWLTCDAYPNHVPGPVKPGKQCAVHGTVREQRAKVNHEKGWARSWGWSQHRSQDNALTDLSEVPWCPSGSRLVTVTDVTSGPAITV